MRCSDTIEDTGVTAQQVAERFGNDVAILVEGVTKLSKLEFASREERQAESFRKMVVAMAKDIRVILVKLADRLHNLRTLEYMPEPKQRASAGDARYLCPLGASPGYRLDQSELEDLSFCYVNSRAYYDIQTKLASTQEARARYLARMLEIIARELEQIHIPCTIAGRPKHLYSIYQKMQRQQLAFEDIHDILAVRVMTDTVRNCYAALGMLHALWKPIPGRFKDYIALPKPICISRSIRPSWDLMASGLSCRFAPRRCTGLPKRALRRTGAIKSRPRRETGRTFCLAAASAGMAARRARSHRVHGDG